MRVSLAVAVLLAAGCGSTPPPESDDVTVDEERLARRIAAEAYERLDREGLLEAARRRAARSSIEETAEASDAILAAIEVEPTTVSARHILIQFRGANRAEGVTRSRAEARELAQSLRLRAADGNDFERLAADHSDGPSASDGGDLGSFVRGRMVREFDDAAFALDLNEVSAVVETEFGFHVIQRYR